MNKKKLLALLVSSAFLFAACGDDDSPSSPKKDSQEISSSSEEDDCDEDECDDIESSSSKKSDNKSSSSKNSDKKSSDSKDAKSSSSVKNKDESSSSTSKENKSSSSTGKDATSSSVNDVKSSSSAAVSSSSVAVPSGARAAKLEDLEKNMELDLFGEKIYLSTGSKQGFFSLRVPDTLWVTTFVDFANGEVNFVKGNVGMEYVDSPKANKIMGEVEKGVKLSFIVDKEGVVKYAVNDSKDYSEAVKAQVAVAAGKVTKAEDIKNKVYSCTDGDTTRSFTFFDNSYILENSASNKVANWIGGHYDIQRSTLLMRPAYYNARSMTTMFGYTIGTDNTITSTRSNAKAMSCTIKDLGDITYQEKNKIVGEWQALDNGIEWQFTIKADGTYQLAAFENNKNIEAKSGVWEIYGNQLMMRNRGCLNKDACTTSIYGEIESKSNGFSFKHSDPDTPKIPTAFESVQYE